MTIDLLKLDRDCHFPNQLRGWWKVNNCDPLGSAKKARLSWVFAVGFFALFLTVFMTAIVGKARPQLMSLVFLFVVAGAFIVALVANSIWSARRDDFARALERLAGALNPPQLVDGLHLLKQVELRSMAELRTIDRVRALLEAERKHAAAVSSGTDRALQDELAGDVACRRQELKDAHAALLAFALVEEKWDAYFDKVNAKLANSRPAEK